MILLICVLGIDDANDTFEFYCSEPFYKDHDPLMTSFAMGSDGYASNVSFKKLKRLLLKVLEVDFFFFIKTYFVQCI